LITLLELKHLRDPSHQVRSFGAVLL